MMILMMILMTIVIIIMIMLIIMLIISIIRILTLILIIHIFPVTSGSASDAPHVLFIGLTCLTLLVECMCSSKVANHTAKHGGP